MPKIVDPETLRAFLGHASFIQHGDFPYEKGFGHFVSERFPNCEEFWRLFIVPLTERMKGYPTSISQENGYQCFRDSTHRELQQIAALHYSVFRHLLTAHLHFEKRAQSLSWLEDAYIHLRSACDLAEEFLDRLYFLLTTCRGERHSVAKKLDKHEFLAWAETMYDQEHDTWYEEYLWKGRAATLYIPSRKLVLREFFEDYLKKPELWNVYRECSHDVKHFGNTFVHHVVLGGIIVEPGRLPHVPKPSKVTHYRRAWHRVHDVAGDAQRIEEDFDEPATLLQGGLEKLETVLNQLWGPVIAGLESEFYSESATLRRMYNIEFSSPLEDSVRGDSRRKARQ